MKTLIHILLGTLLFAGSCSDEMPVCTPAVHGPRHVTFTFSCDALPGTRAVADESRVEDINLYLYPANDAQARHVYAASQRTVALELPDGRYTLYAVANLGTDTGPLPEAEVRALRSAWNPDGSDSGTLPMSAMRTFTVRGTTQIAIELVRAVAKVDFSYTVAADFRNSLSVRSVRLCNVPRFAALFGEGRITADGECAATEAFPADGDGYSAVYYLPENLQGKNVLIPGQEQKNEANAPEYAAYILIEGEADGLHVVYRIYLGENNTSDFNIARNRVYRIEARILGRNTVDWRVSTTEVSVTPFTERHAPGRTATAQLRVVSTNNDRSTCFLTCEREEGDGDVTLDGEPILFGVPYPFLSGDGERIAEIAYTQQREGDVRLRLVLTDETGLHAERVLQTSYVREPLRVSFTQDKFELAALDRARVNFTVEQDDYDGTYTVQVEGTPTLFRNLTDDIGPVTGYTVAGNGTYPLRIRPEAVGENPYRITVTDEKGNSAFFDSFVTGIKTVSCFTCSFSKISGGIEVVAEGAYPVMNDLTITLNPTVTVVLRGGATKTLTCTMNVKIEADQDEGTRLGDARSRNWLHGLLHDRLRSDFLPHGIRERNGRIRRTITFKQTKNDMKKQRIFITAVLLLAALWGAPRRAAAQIFAVRANALAACSATLNVGAETALTDNWSLELSGYWNPVNTASLSMNFHAVQLGGRYWFYESFVGHFLGQHLTYADYDLGSRTKRYKGNAYGLGVSYGYAWMLSKRWNIALEAGIGLFHTEDTRRDPTVSDWEDEYIYRYRRWTLAPTKLEVSFSYIF